MAVKNSHWFRRRFPLPASRLCNLQQSQLRFSECPRKAGRVQLSWVRDSGKGKGEPYKMAVKNSHWFRHRFPLPASRLCNLQQSQLHFNECSRKAGRVQLSWVRDSGTGKGEPYGMAGIVSAIDSVLASRFPLPDTATSNSHSFVSVNAHARPPQPRNRSLAGAEWATPNKAHSGW